MGTHPIFESDFDCLTEMASRVQGGAAARPWWHNPDLDMPVEDIATFYRDHTNNPPNCKSKKKRNAKKSRRKKLESNENVTEEKKRVRTTVTNLVGRPAALRIMTLTWNQRDSTSPKTF